MDIARSHLIPRALRSVNLTQEDVTFDSQAVEEVVRCHTAEQGVRSLERKLGRIINTIGVAARVTGDLLDKGPTTALSLPCRVDSGLVHELLREDKPEPHSAMMLMYA